MTMLAQCALALALVSAVLVFRNLAIYRSPARLAPMRERSPVPTRPVSVLIPARDEERSIGAALEAVLSSEGIDLEVIVLDDASSDRTAEIVERLRLGDARVRLARANRLPDGWCGKQHACAQLATLATHPTLLFIDADVRLAPAAIREAAGALDRSAAALLSGFPRQIVVTPLERLLIPMMHFLLLAYLPMDAMRRTRMPGFGAGCGQFMMVRRDAYERVGGHGAIRNSLHDGLLLPRAFRRAGLRTELVDLTALVDCRMYASAGDVWRGLRKNALEGLAAPGVLGVMTVLLLLGQVVPFVLLAAMPVLAHTHLPWVLGACALAIGTRLALARRFRTPLSSALLHPVGVCVLLWIQWEARLRAHRGLGDSWKGRAYAPRIPRPSSDEIDPA